MTEPGLVYHVLNRRVMHVLLFEKDDDYLAFEPALGESLHRPDAPELLAWRWSSLGFRRNRQSELARWLRPWPVARPRNWLAGVNRSIDEEASKRVRQPLVRGVPLAETRWNAHIARRLGLDITLRPQGRPRKDLQNSS